MQAWSSCPTWSLSPAQWLAGWDSCSWRRTTSLSFLSDMTESLWRADGCPLLKRNRDADLPSPNRAWFQDLSFQKWCQCCWAGGDIIIHTLQLNMLSKSYQLEHLPWLARLGYAHGKPLWFLRTSRRNIIVAMASIDPRNPSLLGTRMGRLWAKLCSK